MNPGRSTVGLLLLQVFLCTSSLAFSLGNAEPAPSERHAESEISGLLIQTGEGDFVRLAVRSDDSLFFIEDVAFDAYKRFVGSRVVVRGYIKARPLGSIGRRQILREFTIFPTSLRRLPEATQTPPSR